VRQSDDEPKWTAPKVAADPTYNQEYHDLDKEEREMYLNYAIRLRETAHLHMEPKTERAALADASATFRSIKYQVCIQVVLLALHAYSHTHFRSLKHSTSGPERSRSSLSVAGRILTF
jgi:hypothetical protein